MNMPTMEEIRQRILAVAALPGWSINRLACESGVEQGSLSRFSRGRDIQKSLSYTTLERLWPFLYGDRRPSPLPPAPHHAPSQPHPDEAA